MSLIGSCLLGQSIQSNSTVLSLQAIHFEIYKSRMFGCEGKFLAYAFAPVSWFTGVLYFDP
jgi:hypothetical protein